MQQRHWISILLFVSGVIVAGIGAAMVFAPIAFHASSGILLGDNVSLMNEMRAMGGGLLGGGLFVIAGAFIERLRFTAVVMIGLLNLSYGLARVLSIGLDGMPANTLVTAAGFEIVIGLLCLGILAFGRMRSAPNA